MNPSYVLPWIVLIAVLVLIASGRMRIEGIAVGGLLLLGLAGVAEPAVIFSGFGHPALLTIIAVFFISEAIVVSGLMRGLGQSIAKRLKSTRAQVLGVASAGAFASAFMNNVGAVGLMLPTAVRMAGRCDSSPGTFGLPLAMGSIIGGSVTMIGSAPNIIIASFMLQSTGSPFRMFDYAPHGLAMLLTAAILWTICKSCGFDPGSGVCHIENHSLQEEVSEPETEDLQHFAPFATRERQIVLAAILPAVILVSFGLVHPALGFGAAVLIMMLFRVLKVPESYRCVDIGIVFFLGAMLGIGKAMEVSGALGVISDLLGTAAGRLPSLLLIVILVFISTALSNAINNAAAAVFMAPLAVGIAAGGDLQPAAALMAVAAGTNLTLLLPTHQATLMVLSKAPFSTASFMRFGFILTLCCCISAALVIALVWQ